MWEKKGLIFNEHHSQLPIVDEYDSFYRIYYSTRIEGKSHPRFIDINKKNFTKIINKGELNLKLGQKGFFDWAGIMPTDIINFDNKKYLYYIGWSVRKDVPYHNNLGLAISTDDGITWNKFSKGPILHTSYKEPGYIGTVEILIENNIWKMWYLSCQNWIEFDGFTEPTYDIKYAESTNGIDWEPKGVTCIPLDDEEGGISSCRVIKKESKYFMWYSVRNKIDYRENINNSYRIKTAESFDGIVWNKNKKIDLDITETSEWDNEMVCYPFIVENNNNLVMFYNGNSFGKTGIGYARKTFK
jgi:hypothetical protein